MTSNQLGYLKYREDVRHNLAMERENRRSNEAQESLTTVSNATNRARQIEESAQNLRGNLLKEYANETDRQKVNVNLLGTLYDRAYNQGRLDLANREFSLQEQKTNFDIDLAKAKFQQDVREWKLDQVNQLMDRIQGTVNHSVDNLLKNIKSLN